MGILKLPLEIWHYILDYVDPVDIANINNTAPAIWQCIFKDTKWLEMAKTYPRCPPYQPGQLPSCAPFLIGRKLSSFRPGKQRGFYVVLVTAEFSGDLQYESKQFFESLQPGWKYNEKELEIETASGLIVNIADVIAPDEATVANKKLLRGRKPHLEYCYYQQDMSIQRVEEVTYHDGTFVLHLTFQGSKREWCLEKKTKGGT